MKTIAPLAFIALMTSVTSFADPGNSEMPYLYPDKDKCASHPSIVIPPNVESTTYFWNRNCTVAYIVPPPTATLKVNHPAPSANMAMCPALERSYDSIASLQTQIQNTIEGMSNLDPADPKFQTYLASINSLQKLITSTQATYNALEGLTVQMSFKGSLTPEYVQAINAANMPMIEQGELKIRPAPLQRSFLSFNAVIPGAPGSGGTNPVLYSNIMGILSQGNEDQNARSTVRFDGATSGVVRLSLMGACPIMSGNFKKISSLKLDARAASQYLVATQTMSVPAVASFGYKATFDTENATNLLFNKFGHAGKFSRDELIQEFLNGEISKTISFVSWTQEGLDGNLSTTYNDMISLENQKTIKEDLAQRYAEQLKEFNALQEIKPLETPAAGNDVGTGVRRECWSSSSWFGLSRSSGCRDVTYQFLIPTDGTSSQRVEITNNLKAVFTDSVEVFHPVIRNFTSTFEFKGE